MSTRYKRVSSIENRFWNSECPIVLEKGALLSDNVQQNNVLQLQFYYTCEKKIKGFKICIDLMEISKEIIGMVEFQYLDINVKKNISFGSNIPVAIPNANARDFVFRIIEIVYEDGKVVTGEWLLSEIKNSEPASKLGDILSVVNISSDSKIFIPKDYDNYWLCGCGAINIQESNNCAKCKIMKQEVFSAFDENRMRHDYEEKIERELVEKRKIEKNKRQLKKRCITGLACVLFIILFVGGWYYYQNIYLVENKYKQACNLYYNGQLEEAKEVFDSIAEYKDVNDYLGYIIRDKKKMEQELIEAEHKKRYEEAKSLEAEENYDDAIVIYTELGDNYDSEERIEICNIEKLHVEIRNNIDIKKYKKALEIIESINEKYKNADVSWSIRNSAKNIINMSDEVYYHMGNDFYEKGKYDKAMKCYNECNNYGDSSKKINAYNKKVKRKYKNVIGAYYKLESDYGSYIVLYAYGGQLLCCNEWACSWDKEKIIDDFHNWETGYYVRSEGSCVIKNKDGSYSVISDDKKVLYMKFKMSNDHKLIVFETPLEKEYENWKKIKGTYTYCSNIKL